MSLVGVEFKKIISKRYVWVLTLLLALFYAYLIFKHCRQFLCSVQQKSVAAGVSGNNGCSL